ncbi:MULTISPECIES: DUF952 domain-containing protein [Actinomadura]|uniref:Uncharacterized conserved protein, DUF952 family n=1 Tax=Actinomadura madurae TaxID=1993 RepID=A0A1I5VG14_9ACTN|nr:DUF952 domain-containing protein [Actinomadura madurae]URN08494.1 DUF952 domain-containing protein [Actinomadura madurae]SFQ06409.1 Uncharacterized conserved protein, DUF952 family [Actinomadura madurae]SPT60600.1 Uncharacterized protein conserved in bacteria [Actinomadura madurae]
MAASPRDTLLHIAERTHWESARAAGVSYSMSTLGRTLDEEGFIHCSSDMAQVNGVLGRFYGGIPREDLVLLAVDVSRLEAPVRYEPAGDELFPHVYGPIPVSAVIEVRSLPENR